MKGSCLAIMLALVVLAPAGARPRASAAARSERARIARQVTFSKDVAPIFQRACQNCHRPGAIAPMSLLTYEDARPWARGIKQKVTAREMPPWFIDRQVGIRKFKDDPSLTDEEIATIAAWVDGGAVRGQRCGHAAATAVRRCGRVEHRRPGSHYLAAEGSRRPRGGADWWGVVLRRLRPHRGPLYPGGRDEARQGAREVVHHAITYLLDDRRRRRRTIGDAERICAGKERRFLPGERRPAHEGGHENPLPDALLTRMGRKPSDRTRVGIKFHPKGRVPKYLQISSTVGDSPEDLDIPAGEARCRHDGYFRLDKPTLLVSFQPHMHMRGKSMCVEAILPTMRVQSISCAKFEFRLEPCLQLRRRCRRRCCRPARSST